jgi:putative molybdopterin biosynthesis protein
MDEAFLYKRIAEDVRLDILEGRLQPGDRLPSMRESTQKWDCTVGTIQRAYQELARQGLVVSQTGKGSYVSGQIPQQTRAEIPLRHAGMVHRAEAFLLESLTAGYDLQEIQRSINMAMDRWRTLQDEDITTANVGVIRFSGSHDMAMVWLSNHMQEIAAGVNLKLNFTGSLGGLMALAEGKADLAGCHLLDADSSYYNEPFVRKLFPGKKMALIHLAERQIGMIVSPGNPLNLHRVEDLASPGIHFLNRQSGSGTRVWLDSAIKGLGIDPAQIGGYQNEKATHSEVAKEIAEKKADAGIGIKSAAEAFGLDFELLANERYDLVTYASLCEGEPLASLLHWLTTAQAKEKLAEISGYDFSEIGVRLLINP